MQQLSSLGHKLFSIISLITISLILAACGGSTPSQPGFSASQANQNLDQVLNDLIQLDNIVNSVLLMDAPDHNYRYLNAIGLANPGTQEAMTGQHTFRIASISKAFIATLTLQLVEEGYFALDTPLSELLENNDLPTGYTLDDLHRFNDQAYGGTITPQQLLQHTSGLRDFMFDGVTDNAPLLERGLVYRSVNDLLNGSTDGLGTRQWNRNSLLNYYLEQGYGNNALFPPGTRHHYSDSGYLLLGAIIEKITGSSLTANLRQRIFTPLNLAHTYHEHFEPARGATQAHHFFDLSLLEQEGNIDVDTSGGNTSAGWAGAGIVSTPNDLLTFVRALLGGRLFKQAATLQTMQTLNATSPYYGLGLQIGTFQDYQIWGHTGYWGTAAACSTEKNACLIMALNQVNANILEAGDQAFKALLYADL